MRSFAVRARQRWLVWRLTARPKRGPQRVLYTFWWMSVNNRTDRRISTTTRLPYVSFSSPSPSSLLFFLLFKLLTVGCILDITMYYISETRVSTSSTEGKEQEKLRRKKERKKEENVMWKREPVRAHMTFWSVGWKYITGSINPPCPLWLFPTSILSLDKY